MFPQAVNNTQISWQILCPKIVGTTHDFCDVVNNSDTVNNLIPCLILVPTAFKRNEKVNIC